MRQFLSEIILPLPILWLFIIAIFILCKRRNHKAIRILLAVALTWFALISTPFVPDMLAESLENQYEVMDDEKIENLNKPLHILVLGAGKTNDQRLQLTNRLSETAVVRLMEGVRLYKKLPGSKLITSGYTREKGLTQAELLAHAAHIMGVDTTDIRTQNKPENTWQEALEYQRLFGRDSVQLILVTSAMHMPRAMYLFQKAGLDPIPAPTDHLVKKSKHVDPWFWMPSSANINKMEIVIHEYVGLAWYKCGGK